MAVKSAERVLEIFELLKDYPEGLTLKEIGQKLGYAGSSTFELAKTLAERGYLQVDEGKRYTLGAKLIQLGAYASAYLDLNKVAAPVLRRLMEQLQETVFMALLSGDEIVYVAIVDSFRSISTNARMGGRKPLYCTGLGKTFLSFLPQEESDAIIDRLHFEKMTPNTITDPQTLRAQLEEFRRQGYAVDNEEIEMGLWCASAPVYNSTGHIEAAISVSGPVNRMKPNQTQIVAALRNAAWELSDKLGYVRREESYGKVEGPESSRYHHL